MKQTHLRVVQGLIRKRMIIMESLPHLHGEPMQRANPTQSARYQKLIQEQEVQLGKCRQIRSPRSAEHF